MQGGGVAKKVCAHLFACSSSFMMSMLMALSSPSPSGTCTWYGDSGTHVAVPRPQYLGVSRPLNCVASAVESTPILWTCTCKRAPKSPPLRAQDCTWRS